jgi:N6-adenosine-specific RNA methylase IME4
MRAVGLLQPIVLRPRQGTGYWLIAGRHRICAAEKLKWTELPATILEDIDADQAELAEIDENLIRAELSSAEQALHHARRKKLYEALYPQTRHGGDRSSSRQNGDLKRFTRDTASKSGKSERSIQRDVARAKRVDVLKEIVGTSLDKGDEIDALAKLPESEQRELANLASEGRKVSAKVRVKQIARQEREQGLAAKQQALPIKKYGVILADPEWRFEPWSRETGLDRAADNHYPTNPLETILERNVACIAAEDSVLFLWATVPMLPQALQVMSAWHFTYRSHLIWKKDRIGTGYWFRNAHELLLVGSKGNIPAPAIGTQWASIVEAPVTQHSAKPECFLEMIEQHFPTLPKIELNRRGLPREGWDAWGNEARRKWRVTREGGPMISQGSNTPAAVAAAAASGQACTCQLESGATGGLT